MAAQMPSSPEAKRVGPEEAAHDDAEAEAVGAGLCEAVLQSQLQARRVALFLPPLAAQRGNRADAGDGLLGHAAGVAVGALAQLGEVGEVLGHPAAGAGDDGQAPHQHERLLPALREPDDDAADEGRHVLHENGSVGVGTRIRLYIKCIRIGRTDSHFLANRSLHISAVTLDGCCYFSGPSRIKPRDILTKNTAKVLAPHCCALPSC